MGPRKNKVWVTGTEEHGEHGFNTTKKACPTAKIISPKLDTNTLYPPLNLPHPAASPRPDLSLRYKSSFRKVRTRVRAALGGNFSKLDCHGRYCAFFASVVSFLPRVSKETIKIGDQSGFGAWFAQASLQN